MRLRGTRGKLRVVRLRKHLPDRAIDCTFEYSGPILASRCLNQASASGEAFWLEDLSESRQYKRGSIFIRGPASMRGKLLSSCPENARNPPDKAGQHSCRFGDALVSRRGLLVVVVLVVFRVVVVVVVYNYSRIYAGISYMYLHGCILFKGSLADSPVGGAFCPEARRMDPVPHLCQVFL